MFHHVLQRTDRIAFSDERTQLTWRDLDDQSRRFAGGLQSAGVEAGDRVAAFLETSTDLVVAFVGTLRAGAVWVPVNTRYRETEVEHILADAEPRIVLAEQGSESARVVAEVWGESDLIERGGERWDSLFDATGRVVERNPEELALFIYTSGTTGKSKGVMHTYHSVTTAIGALTKLWRWTPDDELVLALPLFHVHGLGIGVIGTLLNGNRAVLQSRFDPASVVDALADGGTIFMGVPTMYARLIEYLEQHSERADALRKVRLFTSGSDALPADNFAKFEQLTGHRILERYGMSETMLTLSNPYEPERRRPGSIGFPVPGMEARIVNEEFADVETEEVGELLVRGPFLMRGYWRQKEKTEASFRDGWFITGDAARRDSDGYVHHAGRRSTDILKCGGYKISAREIERVLRAHADVREVAVVGLPDPEWGQTIAAALVPARDVELSELVALLEPWIAERLADYKRPRKWRLISELPRNAMGKVQKAKLMGTSRFATIR